jgi:hypothetical protein
MEHINSRQLSKIALVSCYFGKLPNYSKMVFHSAGFNTTIDWLLIGDAAPDFLLPPNVKYYPYRMDEVANRIAKNCGSPVSINHPIDLTRLKPTYGLAFADLLEDYDWWGHVDLDMIYGDLRKYLPENILATHERLYARGHLSIFRNTPEGNSHFMKYAPGAPDYQEILANKSHRQFDEWDGIWQIYRYHKIPQYHKEVIADIRAPTETRIGRFEATELPNYLEQLFYWHEGKTFQLYYHHEGGLFDREVAYIHFQKRRLPTPNFDPEQVRGFSIGPDGFMPYDRENLTRAEVTRRNPDRMRSFSEICRIKSLRARRKVLRILSQMGVCKPPSRYL